MRLLALFALAFLLYRALKTWISNRAGPSLGRPAGREGAMAPMDDLMVKDPQCQIYLSKRDGVALEHEGQTLYFCSAECREKFLDSRA